MFCPKCGKPNEPAATFCSQCGDRLPIAVSVASLPPQTHGATEPVLFAGFWRRLAAMILDWLITVVVAVVIGVSIGLLASTTAVGEEKFLVEALGNLAGFLLSWLYFAFMESSAKQATLGKMALGIKVTDLQGNRISFGRASGRFFAKILSALSLAIGYLMAGFTKRRQALHDVVAGCLVVRESVTFADVQRAGPAPGLSTGAIVALAVVGSLVPLTGILAAIAIPAYQDYVVRAKMVEVSRIGDLATKSVDAFIASNNTIPTQLEQAGFSAQSTNVKRVVIDGQNGIVFVTANFSPILDKVLVFVPSMDQNKLIVWKCGSEDIPAKYLPERCR